MLDLVVEVALDHQEGADLFTGAHGVDDLPHGLAVDDLARGPLGDRAAAQGGEQGRCAVRLDDLPEQGACVERLAYRGLGLGHDDQALLGGRNVDQQIRRDHVRQEWQLTRHGGDPPSVPLVWHEIHQMGGVGRGRDRVDRHVSLG
ncbi:hypothetical protein D3C86_1381430 [compost metagenome]